MLDSALPGRWRTLGATLLVVGPVGVAASLVVPTAVRTEAVANGETVSSPCSADRVSWLASAVGFAAGIACALGGG